MAKSVKNYYEILGVTPDVEPVELKKVYRRLVRRFHPDINPNGAIIFKDITEAYETLSDDKLRHQYDILNGIFKKSYNSAYNKTENKEEPYRKSYKKAEDIKSKTTNPNKEFSKKEPKEATNKTEHYSKKQKDYNFEDLINEFIDGFSEISRKNKKTSMPKPENGEDINADIVITFYEALYGANKVVNVVHTRVCEKCQGRRFINGAKCPNCGGSGKVTEHQKINVKIPANIKSGTKLRLPGEGNKGVNGGKNGNLYLKITVETDSTFKKDGNDLLCEVAISPYEAILGGDIKVPVFEEFVNLKIPEYTKSGQVFRISSKALKQKNLVGDIIITVRIQIPDKVSEEERKLYESLRELSGAKLRENSHND